MSTEEKETWFNKTLRRLESPLLGYTYKIILKAAPSEEVVQEGFLKLWTQEYPFGQKECYPKAWLYKVCRNMAIDYLRKESKMDLDGDLENVLGRPCISEELFDSSVIIQEISKLSAIEQEVLVLKFSDELSYKEISEMTGLTVSNVGVKIHEGIRKIRAVVLKELKNLEDV